jgi:hypothetical protein
MLRSRQEPNDAKRENQNHEIGRHHFKDVHDCANPCTRDAGTARWLFNGPTVLQHRRSPHLDHGAHLSRRSNDRGHARPFAVDHQPEFPSEWIRPDFARSDQYVIALLLPEVEASWQLFWRAVPTRWLVSHHAKNSQQFLSLTGVVLAAFPDVACLLPVAKG